MAFTYAFMDGSNEPIDTLRGLIADTTDAGHVWEDSELLGFVRLQAMQFQSGMGYNAPNGQNLPASPVSLLRVAALMLDATANNEARLTGLVKLLDVTLDRSKAAAMLHSQADSFRKIDDESGAFAIIEQVFTGQGMRDRFWREAQRQSL